MFFKSDTTKWNRIQLQLSISNWSNYILEVKVLGTNSNHIDSKHNIKIYLNLYWIPSWRLNTKNEFLHIMFLIQFSIGLKWISTLIPPVHPSNLRARMEKFKFYTLELLGRARDQLDSILRRRRGMKRRRNRFQPWNLLPPEFLYLPRLFHKNRERTISLRWKQSRRRKRPELWCLQVCPRTILVNYRRKKPLGVPNPEFLCFLRHIRKLETSQLNTLQHHRRKKGRQQDLPLRTGGHTREGPFPRRRKTAYGIENWPPRASLVEGWNATHRCRTSRRSSSKTTTNRNGTASCRTTWKTSSSASSRRCKSRCTAICSTSAIVNTTRVSGRCRWTPKSFTSACSRASTTGVVAKRSTTKYPFT